MESNNTNTESTKRSRTFTSDIYTSLKTQCDEAGISISKLCKEANVNRSILERWKHVEPKSIQTYNKLVETLSRIQSRKNL